MDKHQFQMDWKSWFLVALLEIIIDLKCKLIIITTFWVINYDFSVTEQLKYDQFGKQVRMISIQQTPDTDCIKVHIQDGRKLSMCLLITVLLVMILIKKLPNKFCDTKTDGSPLRHLDRGLFLEQYFLLKRSCRNFGLRFAQTIS